jgi:hypothetical protein
MGFSALEYHCLLAFGLKITLAFQSPGGIKSRELDLEVLQIIWLMS